jgi:hypothetical protein
MDSGDALKAALSNVRELLQDYRSGGDQRTLDDGEATRLGITDGPQVRILDTKKMQHGRLFKDSFALMKFSNHFLPKQPFCIGLCTNLTTHVEKMATILEPKTLLVIGADISQIGDEKLGATGQSDAVQFVKGEPSQEFEKLSDNQINYAFLNGSVDYARAKSDLDSIREKMAPGGVLQCTNYAPWISSSMKPSGVMAAVNKFINENSCSVLGISLDPSGLHNILIRMENFYETE